MAMAGDDPKKSEQAQRMHFRRNIHHVWEMVQSNRRDELSDRDNDLAEILVEHEEYRDHFENIDILDGCEYADGATFNPFLHISTHRMVEDQLAAESPIETALFCEALEGRGFPRHEAVHFVIMILLHVLFSSSSGRRPFDAARYKRLLIKCRDVEPAEMEKVIAEDFTEHPSRRNLH